MTETAVPFEPRFGAFVIESLTLGMYGESRNAIREYVQNSFDSLQGAIEHGLITHEQARVDVEMDADRRGLTIRDNGLGLRTENASSVLAAIGASNKNYRNNAGFRGIGRLAGIVFCDRLIFEAKAKGQSEFTRVLFKAALLREKLSPDGSYEKDAAETLAECVEATRHSTDKIDEHYFKVRLEHLHNPPLECLDAAAMRAFLGQVAPLPYDPAFGFGNRINERASEAGFAIDTVRVFLKDGQRQAVELFKPYENDVAVKKSRTPLAAPEFLQSPSRKWWGWVARKRTSGAIKDPWKGIRVRIRNIQIDDTKVIREIFAESHLTDKPRSSYSRFADWYVGEIFVHPEAAIPNARRDGFEENEAWEAIRNELDLQVATPLGKAAYRTSKADQLSVDNLTKSFDTLDEATSLLEVEANPTANSLEPLLEDVTSLRKRVADAMKIAEEGEAARLEQLAVRRVDLQRRLEALYAHVPAHSCDEEIREAIQTVAKELLEAFKERSAPHEWQRARTIITEITGVRFG